MSTSRATEEALGALHGLLAETLTAQLVAARESGEPIPPALLGQVIKFLKDNGVDAPAATSAKLDRLANALPDIDELDNVVSFKR